MDIKLVYFSMSVTGELKSLWDATPKILSFKRVCAALGCCTAVAIPLKKHLQSTFSISFDKIEVHESQLGPLHAAIAKWYAEWLELLAPPKLLLSWIESKSSKTLRDLLNVSGFSDISHEDALQLEIHLQEKLEPIMREKVDDVVLYQPDELLAVVSYTRDWYNAAKYKRWADAELKREEADSAFMEQFIEPATKRLMAERATMWKWWADDKTTPLLRPFLAESESDKPVPALDLVKYIPGAKFERTLDWYHHFDELVTCCHIFQMENKSFIMFPDSATSGADARLQTSSTYTEKKDVNDRMIVYDFAEKIRSGRIYPTWEDVMTAKREAQDYCTYKLAADKLKPTSYVMPL
ncbi:MAG: hypothetical protein Hyperionvirus3_11 [Hyperionvirus sp.]|uniref:Uncharacterized protein n=1 Tax=Hyperionvirus sp. TaxID=2487770 RepID=A0A3G5A6J8_9VIRU|nr:MAG: hypothetical protein Hyperionvirus3_11 [Hyperionvirus sp.]